MYLDNQELPLGKGVVLLHAAHGLLAFCKPAGMLSHPNGAKDIPRSLLRAPYDLEQECYKLEDGKGTVWLLNRLDSATSGVLLGCTDEALAAVIREQFVREQVKKKYYALTFGTMKPVKQVWKDQLDVVKKGGRLRTSARGDLPAQTDAMLSRSYPGRIPVSLLELYPKTGRTHQLRVQCAARRLPVIGDETYGNFSWNREFVRRTGERRMFLHSAEVTVSFRIDGRNVSFQARSPLPSEFSSRR